MPGEIGQTDHKEWPFPTVIRDSFSMGVEYNIIFLENIIVFMCVGKSQHLEKSVSPVSSAICGQWKNSIDVD